MSTRPHRKHLKSAEDLVTPYEAVRAGFVAMALEKNRQATPFIQQARALRSAVGGFSRPLDLLDAHHIEPSLLVAAGVSDKATAYLQDSDRREAILALIQNYLEPQGENWAEELVYRFLLTRGDSLGGMMRNIAGALAQRKTTRAILSALGVIGETYRYWDSESNLWLPKPENDADVELRIKGIGWQLRGASRTLVFNIKVPAVNKNVDMCLLNCGPEELSTERTSRLIYRSNELYLALGELKGGIDPAGADEHWKTASTALKRIGQAFGDSPQQPLLFFIGAAIEKDMAAEIWNQLESAALANAANLTNESQLASLCLWLCEL